MKKKEQLASCADKQSASPEDYPKLGTALAVQRKYLPYPRAMALLSARLGATPEELAAWVFIGPEHGGLGAYERAYELADPWPFSYAVRTNPAINDEYVSPLIILWFLEEEIINFYPTQRFITGKSLVERWAQIVEQPKIYIVAKTREDRLRGFHPVVGLMQMSSGCRVSFPPLEVCLFAVSEIEKIEVSDFGLSLSPRKKLPCHLNHDPEMQKRANEIAAGLKTDLSRGVRREDVAKILASELGMTKETVLRRIRKQW